MADTILSVIMILCNLYYCIVILMQKRHAFMISSIGCAILTYVLIQNRLYANAVLNIVFIGINTWLFFSWGKDSMGKVQVRRATTNNLLRYAYILLASYIILSTVLHRTDNPMPYIDALTTSLAIVSAIMMDKKYIEHIYFGLIGYIIMIGSFILLQEYLNLLTYVIYAIAMIIRLIVWEKELKTEC